MSYQSLTTMRYGGSSNMSMFRNLLMQQAAGNEIRFSDSSVKMDTSKNETEKKTRVISNTDWKLDVKL